MDETTIVATKYQVPEYKLEANEVWFHFLHGNVPRHEIDFMYRPTVPQPPFTRQHFSHLARLVKYIEPRPTTAYSFAITNLSRDDNQYEPGHGGVAFVFGLRINGVRDHAGRQDPPFCHAAAVVDRHLDASMIYHVAVQFHKKLLPVEESEVEGSGWYRSQYVPHAENPAHLEIILKSYVKDFEDLYVPGPSRQTLRWSVDGATVPRRVTILYPDRVDFPTLAASMARVAEVLIESNVKWTAISNGREQDVPGGLTVRFVPRREAVEASADEVLLYLEQVPENPAEIAYLFNAREVTVTEEPRMSRLPPGPQVPARVNGVHESEKLNGSAHVPSETIATRGDHPARPWAKPEPEAEVEEDPAIRTQGLGIVAVVERKEAAELQHVSTDWAAELKKNERMQRKQTTKAMIATVLFIAVFGGLALIWFASAPTPRVESTAPANSAPASPAPIPQGATTVDAALPSASANTVSPSAPSGVIVPPVETIQVQPAGTGKKAPGKGKTPDDVWKSL